MKGNKFLAAALAASMVFSTVPATALSVFADSVSVEASDAGEKVTSQTGITSTTTTTKTGQYDAAKTAIEGATLADPTANTYVAASGVLNTLTSAKITVDGNNVNPTVAIATDDSASDKKNASFAALGAAGSSFTKATLTYSKTNPNASSEPNAVVNKVYSLVIPVTLSWDVDESGNVVSGSAKVVADAATTDTMTVTTNADASAAAKLAAEDLSLIKTDDLVISSAYATNGDTNLNDRLDALNSKNGTYTATATYNDTTKLLTVTFTAPVACTITTDLHDGKSTKTSAGATATVTSDEAATIAAALQAAANDYAGDVTSEKYAPASSAIADGISKYLPKGENVVAKGEATVADKEGSTTQQTVTQVVIYKGVEYTVKFDIAKGELTNAQKMAKIKDTVQKALEAHTFSASSEDDTLNEVKKVVDDALTTLPDSVKETHKGNKLQVTYGDLTDSEDSDENNRGKVSGTVKLHFDADEADASGKKTFNSTDHVNGTDGTYYAAVAAIDETVSFTAKRAYADEKLTDDMATAVKTWLGQQTFENGDNGEAIAKRVNALLTSKNTISLTGKSINGKVYNEVFNGVTATVTNPRRVDAQTHGGNVGTGTVDVTLSNGSGTTKSFTTTIEFAHSDSEKLDELDKAITDLAATFTTTKYQKKNASTAATDAQVKTAVTDYLEKAIETKVSNKSLKDVDGWKDAVITVTVKNTTKGASATDPSYTYTYKDGKWVITDDEVVGPQRIEAIVQYTPATAKAEGKAEASVTSYIVDTDADNLQHAALTSAEYNAKYTSGSKKDAEKKSSSFTLTFATLKAKANTYLRFSQGSYSKQYDSSLVDNSDSYYTYSEDGDGNRIRTSVSETDENDGKDNTYDISDLLQTEGTDELEWTSSDESVVTIPAAGLITLKGTGTATVTVTDKDNSKLSASITINATNKYVFDDVQNVKDFFYTPVEWATRNYVTKGISDTEFGVKSPVTRAQFITWLYRAAGEPTVAADSTFSDVAADAYYAKAVAWGVQNGVVTGTSATTFSPDKVVTREQAVTFLYRRYGDGEKYIAKTHFTDVSEKSYAYDAIQWAENEEVTKGKTATTFAPTAELNRAEGITFVYRSVNHLNGQ